MKTSELKGPLLDYWVAKAEGSADAEIENWGSDLFFCISSHDAFERVPFEPSIKWSRGGLLIEKYHLNISETDPPGWVAWSDDLDMEYGETPLQAVCRAVVRGKFGDEVDNV